MTKQERRLQLIQRDDHLTNLMAKLLRAHNFGWGAADYKWHRIQILKSNITGQLMALKQF